MKTASAKLLGGIAFCLLLLCAINYTVAKATDNPYPWAAGTPTLDKLQTYVVGTGSPAPANITGNDIDCNNDTFIWRPEKNLGLYNYQSQATLNVCSYKTDGGMVSTSNFAKLNGVKVAGRITGPAGDIGSLLAVPNSSSAIELTSSSTGSYIKILDNAYSGLQVTKNTDGSIAYKITKPSPTLKNKYNQLISIQLGSMSYSEDGSWAVVDAPGTGLLRINIKTHEVLPFADGFTYGNGSSPSLQTAISNDGRYAVVASFTGNSFKLYDLASCTAVATSAVYNCQSRDLLSFLKIQLPTLYGSADKIRFITNDMFNFYATYDRVNTNNRKIGLFSLTTPSVAATKMDYLAMGDSFASGEGTTSYRAGTDIPDNRCHQSELSYPYLLDSTLGTGLFKSVACSGAKIKDIVLTERTVYNDNDPQGKNKTKDSDDPQIFTDFLPGYRAQLNFVKNNAPKVITISTGGNDIGFSSIIQKCVIGSDTCYDNYEERLELVHNINNIYPSLLDMYQSIKKSAAQDAKIYVIGYPQIAKVDGNCAVNVHFNNDEIIFGKQLITYLNRVIKMAADNAGVAFVDTEGAFVGHKLCEATYSNVAVNGLSLGNSAPLPGIGPFASESYHPNDMGHRLFSDAIIAATGGFTLTSPAAKNSAPVFPAESSIDLLDTAPKTNRAILNTKYSNNLSGDFVYTEQTSQVTVAAAEYSLKPNTSFSLTLYSTPTNLGSITSDANGDINSTFIVPKTVEPGYHTLHLVGNNINDEVIDIQKIIYVAASDTDFDGDGITNANEPCVVGDASGQDTDKDGVDDACDAVIGEPPVVIVVPPTDPEPTTPVEVVVVPPVTSPVVESEKVLPESESNPQWLIDLTVQKQAELSAQLLAAAVTPAPQSSPRAVAVTNNSPQNSPQPEAPTTVVAGASTSAPKVAVSAGVLPQTYTRQTPELTVLLVAVGLLGFGVLLVLWKLNKQKV